MTETSTIRLEIERSDALRLTEGTLWGFVAIAFVADIATTAFGLQIGLYETNPVGVAVLEYLGIIGLIVVKLLAVGSGFACRPLLAGAYRLMIPMLLALMWIAASIINIVAISAALGS